MLGKFLNIFKVLFPWLVAAGLFYYLFKKIPPKQFFHSLQYVSPLLFTAFAIFYFLALLCVDTWGLSKVLSKFSGPVNFSKLLPGRCVSYLLSIVNYNAGQAGIAVYLKRTQGTSFFKTLGSILFVAVTDLYWIIALAFFGSFFLKIEIQGISLKYWVQWVAIIAAIALLVHLAFWHRWFARIFPFQFHFAFADWIRGRHLFQPFHHARLKDYFWIAFLRLPIHLMIIGSIWVLIRIFGATIPLREVVGIVPLIFLFGALPITPGGLGTVQLATVELLKDKISSPEILQGALGPEELLLALSLSWMAANYLLKAVSGLYFLFKSPKGTFRENPALIPFSNNAPHSKNTDD